MTGQPPPPGYGGQEPPGYGGQEPPGYGGQEPPGYGGQQPPSYPGGPPSYPGGPGGAGGYGPPQPGYGPGYGGYPAPQSPQSSTPTVLAVIGIVCLLFCSPAAIVLGIIAQFQFRAQGRSDTLAKVAWIGGIVLFALGIVLFVATRGHA